MYDLRGRRSIRLKGFDYSSPGYYFVTICISGRLPLLGTIDGHCMTLNAAGKMVTNTWNEIPVFYPCSGVDAASIMPNHVHGIVAVGAEPRLCPCSQPLPREPENEGQSRGVCLKNGLRKVALK
jgi:putative transposase